jgi:hypothetical protein
VKSRATVIIPLDDCVRFVSSLNRADFSSWLSEVAQTLDPISGIQLLPGGRGLGERWPLGTVAVRDRPSVRQGWLGSLTQFGHWLFGASDHSVFSCPRGQKIVLPETVHRLDRHSIGPKEWLGRSKLHSFDN